MPETKPSDLPEILNDVAAGVQQDAQSIRANYAILADGRWVAAEDVPAAVRIVQATGDLVLKAGVGLAAIVGALHYAGML